MLDISAVMMTYNAAPYLVTTLPALTEVCREIVILDMESLDETLGLCAEILRPNDIIIKYPRRNLFTFGFSHPRNYAGMFSTSDWILTIDSDEYVEPGELSRVFYARSERPDVFDLERRNYAYRDGLSLERPTEIMAQAEFTVERHRRLYRRDPAIRYEGLIHEEIWERGVNAYATCENLDVALHHLSAYGAREPDKYELYAYLLMKAQVFPGFRYGTNAWFFERYVPDNADVILAQANNFAARHDLLPFGREDLDLERRDGEQDL